MAGKITDRIDALEQRLKELKMQHQRVEARRRALTARRERREELRKKILVGAVVLARAERGEIAQEVLLNWLEEALTREDDRALFGLAPIAPPR